MIEIKQLSGISIDTVHEAFSKAFADYVEPFDLTVYQLQHMIERRGCDLNLSFGAFDNNQLVGFTLNGIGKWKDSLTAYDTGTGIIKEYRKRGIATRLFNESLPVLKQYGISQYLLEVISSNTSAFELYKKAGFQVTRKFDYYISPKINLRFRKSESTNEFVIKVIESPDWELFASFRDFEPSWQNSTDSINRKFSYFKILGIFEGNNLAGYGIIETTTGDIPQFAIHKDFRRKGLFTMLLIELINFTSTDIIKFINTDESYQPFKEFAQSINLVPGIGQYEMELTF